MAAAKTKITLQKALPWILLIGGIVGYICSFIIMNDKVQILKNPLFIPSCNLNPIISCGSVMQSKQAAALGFPNPFIGLGAFPAVAVVGGAMLAGARFKRWFWRTLLSGYALGIVFAYWLLFESIYRIHALCPYCLTIDVVMTISLWYLTLYVFDQGHLKIPNGQVKKVYGFIRRHHLDFLVAWILIVIALILKHFWYYYSHHL
jgi:uncharacterized membrane protein